MVTVGTVLAEVWEATIAQDFREMHPYVKHGRSDPRLPSKSLVKYVFPTMLGTPRAKEGRISRDTAKVCRDAWWREDLDDETSATVRIELERVLVDNRANLEDLNEWVSKFRECATELGIEIPDDTDARSVMSWAFAAAYNSLDPGVGANQALQDQVKAKLGANVLTVSRLREALKDEETRKGIDMILRSWRDVAREGRPTVAEELEQWESFVRSFVVAAQAGELALGTLWSEQLRGDSLGDFRHVWRARRMRLSVIEVEVGARIPAPSIDGEGQSDRPLDRNLLRRLEGLLGPGANENKMGYPPASEVLADVARRSLAPFSLNERANRLTLVLGCLAIAFVPEDGQEIKKEPSLVQRIGGPIFRKLRTLDAERRRDGTAFSDRGLGGDQFARVGISADMEGKPIATSEAVGATKRASTGAAAERYEHELQDRSLFRDDFVSRLWARLHNDEVRSLREVASSSRLPEWAEVQRLFEDIAGQIREGLRKSAERTSKRPNRDVIDAAVGASVKRLGLRPEGLQRELEATFAEMGAAGLSDFLTAVSKLEGDLDENPEAAERVDAGDAALLWNQARERIRGVRAREGVVSPSVQLDDVIGLISLGARRADL